MKESDKEFKLKVIPSRDLNIGRKYANHFIVTHGDLEFHLQCVDIVRPTEFNEQDLVDEKNRTLKAPVVADIVIPAPLIPNIIEMFKTNWEQYMESQKKKIELMESESNDDSISSTLE